MGQRLDVISVCRKFFPLLQALLLSLKRPSFINSRPFSLSRRCHAINSGNRRSRCKYARRGQRRLISRRIAQPSIIWVLMPKQAFYELPKSRSRHLSLHLLLVNSVQCLSFFFQAHMDKITRSMGSDAKAPEQLALYFRGLVYCSRGTTMSWRRCTLTGRPLSMGMVTLTP